MTDLLLQRLCVLLSLASISIAGCGEIESDPPTDNDGNPIAFPDPGEEWLFVVGAEPEEEMSTHPTIALQFNQYLDETTFNSFGTMRLVSGGRSAFGLVDYRMTRKTVLFQPYNQLAVGLTYSVDWMADDVQSVSGSPLHPRSMYPFYTVRDDLEPTEPFRRPAVDFDDVQPLFDAYCNDCHGDSSWGLPSLTRDGLVGTRSEQTDTMLVEPYAPARSYLMHKILPDYPIRRHTVQPPPYSEHAGALSTDDIELIEHWIARGAPD